MGYYLDLHITKDRGRWKGYMYYYDAEGKRHQVSKLAPKECKTKRDAKRYLEAWKEKLEAEAKKQGRVVHTKKGVKDSPTVREMITSLLERQFATGRIERSTFKTQMNLANSQIFPYLGDYLFADLDVVAIESWLTELFEKGLSPNYIHSVYAVANKAYHHLYKTGQIPNNPFEFVDTPHKSQTRVTHLDIKGTEDLLAAIEKDYAPGNEMRTAIFLAYYAGLRRGEICGLRWCDVNLSTGLLSINSSIGIGIDGSYSKAPKNRSSIRTFPILPQLQAELENRYEVVKSTYDTVSNSWYVAGDTVHYLAPSTFSRRFHDFAEKHNLVDAYGRAITLHGLRHNYASVGIRAHMDIASLSLMMGHASRSITLDVYGDASADALLVASEKLGNTFNDELENGYQGDYD